MWFRKYKINEKEISPSKCLQSSRQDRQIYSHNYNTSKLLIKEMQIKTIMDYHFIYQISGCF